MNLKKSDKIIAVVGVIILIIAGISIAVIISSEKEEKEEEVLKERTFYVTWTKETGEMPLDCYAGKKAPYSEPIIVTTSYGSVLTSVDFQLTWTDDCTYFGILSKGLDTLKAEISLAGGESKTDTSIGSGNMAFPFSVNDIPLVDSVEAEDVYEAEEIINETFRGQDVASFDVTVTVSTGEKLRRPLKFLKDKGNGFELKIIYEYYSPMIKGEYGEEDYGEEENAVGEEGYGYQGVIGLFYKNLCCGRGWV